MNHVSVGLSVSIDRFILSMRTISRISESGMSKSDVFDRESL
jgi:hypothetical protein